MKELKKINNPFIIFSPLLILYSVLIIYNTSPEIIGDEVRFLMFAENLTHGYFSPPPPALDLGNGPGYPLIIAPLISLNLPLIYIELLNGIFYYISVVLLFISLRTFVPKNFSIIFCLFWAFYPSFYEHMNDRLPEIFTAFLIVLFIYTSIKVFEASDFKKTLKYIVFSGVIFGYLALTKPIFGYVIMFLIPIMLVFFLFKKKNVQYKKTLLVLIISFITTLPYLAYTYNLSGKLFYWSSFGGNNLYWMSSPYENEYGDWMGFPPSKIHTDKIPGSDSMIISRHQKDFNRLLSNKDVQIANVRENETEYNLTKGTAQDDLLKKIAIENIKSHPGKFVENIISNGGRILFNYPSSYTLQKSTNLRRLPINGTLAVVSLFCLILTFLKWRDISYPIRYLLCISFIYLGGSLLGSAGSRMLFVVIPILLLWIAYILYKSIKIDLTWK